MGAADGDFALLLVVHAQDVAGFEPGHDFLDVIDVDQPGAVHAPENFGIELGLQLLDGAVVGGALDVARGHVDAAVVDVGVDYVSRIDQQHALLRAEEKLGGLASGGRRSAGGSAERAAARPVRRLRREPQEISLTEIIAAIEGPMALTECSTEVTGLCNIEAGCPIKSNQRIINQAVRGVLERITLSDLVQPLQLTTIKDARGNNVPTIASGRIQ